MTNAAMFRPKVVVIGSINMDLVVRCQRLASPGETLPGTSLQEIPGGKGANQAVAAARLGGDVTMVGKVGNDAFATTLLNSLRQAGVHTDHVATAADCGSGIAIIQVENSGQNSIIVVPGANALVSVDDVHRAEAAIAAADVVLLQLEIPVETVAAAVQLARRHQVPVIVDPAPARTDLPAEILSADWLCPNETEAEVLSGFSVRTPVDAANAAAALRTTDQTTVVITLGDQGAVCHTGEATLHLEAFPVTPVDTTAAGDAFAAALGIAIAKDCLPAMAVRYAAAAGALAATQPGAQPGMPTADAVDQLLNNHSPSQHLL